MKTKLQFLRWLMVLMLSVSALGTWGQPGPYPNTGAQTVCFNATEQYGVNPTSGSIYTWTIIKPNVGDLGDGIINGSPSDKISVKWTSAGTCTLRVVVSTATCTGDPVDITITVLPQLTAPVIAAAQTICYGAIPAQLTMPILPTGGNGTYTYQWQSSSDGTTWTNISGATGTTFAPPALTATTSYQVIATTTGAQACGIVPTSNVIKITVDPQLGTSPIYHN